MPRSPKNRPPKPRSPCPPRTPPDPARKAKLATAIDQPKRLSALDTAAKVLAEARNPLNCQELIERMASKGYGSSLGGKTPAATRYSAIIRELATKGEEARFGKTDCGMFLARGTKAAITEVRGGFGRGLFLWVVTGAAMVAPDRSDP